MKRAALVRSAMRAAAAARTGDAPRADALHTAPRFSSSSSSDSQSTSNTSDSDSAKGSLGSHFGETREHKESLFLKAFVTLGSGIEKASSLIAESKMGSVVAPKQQQVHRWGQVEKEEIVVEENEEGEKVVKTKKEDQRVQGVAINTEQHAVIAVGEVEDHTQEETAWGLFKALLTQKAFKTTQQQATDVLYELIPDFSEAEFLEDIETQLLPAFLNAFWAKDKEALASMCSDACYHLNVDTHLKQYEKVESRCSLLMTRRAALFNRLMFVDDSDHAPSVKRRAALMDQGVDFDGEEDLDVDGEKPEAIFFVSCSAHVINDWVDKSGETAIGSKYDPEDWYFVFGLTPRPGPTWTLSSLEFTKMQAMGSASTGASSA
eukprot:TRINITY_DN18509_c0_g1_i2.p1 TRINITY_DN18509_c0_g1~~TRINITY_DN18509_c0_g1_i2.p1  ORF type:complete len:377 (+),score=142.41 TRINITY_DN18509_c0_g1_i2:219-1349(+)